MPLTRMAHCVRRTSQSGLPLEGKEAALKLAEDYAGQPGMAENKLLQESSKKNAEIMINGVIAVGKNFGVEFPLKR